MSAASAESFPGWLQCGDFRVHLGRREVVRNGDAITMSWRGFEALAVLIRANGAVVERSELISKLWPGVHVEDSSLNHCIVQIRRALGDGVVETVPRVGYRFLLAVNPVIEDAEETSPVPSEPAAVSRAVSRRKWLWAAALFVIVGASAWGTKTYFDIETRKQEVQRLDQEAAHLARWGRMSEISEASVRLQRAASIDPKSAYTHALIAETMARTGQAIPGQERLEAERAVQLDPGCGECRAILGWILMSREWKWDGAGEHLAASLKMAPGDAYAHQWYAQYLAARGDLEQAVNESAKAAQLEAWNPSHVSTHAGMLYLDGRYAEAEIECRRALALRPSYPAANTWLADVLFMEHRYEEAIRTVVTVDTVFAGLSADLDQEHATRALNAFRFAGLPGAAKHFLAELTGPQESLKRYDRARWKVLSGDSEGAVDELRKGIQFRPYQMMFLKVDPVFKPVANDPEFRKLLGILGS